MMQRAILRRPTGFSEPRHYESEVVVHGFCFGTHTDARRYNSPASCVLAVIENGGAFDAVPLQWLSPLTPQHGE